MSFAPITPMPVIAVVAALGVLVLVGGVVVWRRTGSWRWVRRAALVLLVALAGLNPVIGAREVSTASRNLDVVFALDTTGSSAAEDYLDDQPRIEGMRADMRAVIAQYPGARYSIVGFDRSTNLLLPLTEDADAASSAIDVVRPEISAYSSGTSITQPVDVLEELLDRRQSAQRTRLLIVLSDGEVTRGARSTERYARLAPLIDGGAVFGYGSSQGAAMRATSGTSLEPGDYLREGGTGARSRSRIDESTLRSIAERLDVPYTHRTAASPVEPHIELDRGSVAAGGVRVSSEIELGSYWLIAIAITLLVLVEAMLLVAPVRGVRRLPGVRR